MPHPPGKRRPSFEPEAQVALRGERISVGPFWPVEESSCRLPHPSLANIFVAKNEFGLSCWSHPLPPVRSVVRVLTRSSEPQIEPMRRSKPPLHIPPRLRTTPVEELELSTRISNALLRSGFQRLADFAGWGVQDFRQIPLLGRKGAAELVRGLRKLGVARVVPGATGSAGEDDRSQSTAGGLSSDSMGSTTPAPASDGPEFGTASEESCASESSEAIPPHPTYSTPAEWWEQQSAALKGRERRIVAARFPDRKTERLTLDELGAELGVTRERVRQIRNRTFEKLNDGRGIPKSVDQMLWRKLALSTNFVIRDPDAWDAALEGLERLYLTVHAGGIEEWLDATSQYLGNAFYRGPLHREAILQASLELERSFQDLVARRLEDLKLGEGVPWALAAVVSENLIPYRQYACRRPLTTYRRRALDLHDLLVGRGRPIPLLRLWVLAREAGSSLTVNDVQRTVSDEDFSHLFLDCGDLGIGAVDWKMEPAPPFIPVTDYLAGIPVQAAEALKRSPPNEGDQTIAGQLASVLASEGPLPSRELIARFRERTEARYPDSSAAAVLTIHGAFVRLAPGVYGLPRHLLALDPVSTSAEFLLNENDLFWYVLARQGGEPLNAFPLWTSGMEFDWVRWGEGAVPSRLYNGLLSVAEPSKWPVSEVARNRFHGDGRCNSMGPISELPADLEVSSVDLERLFAVARVAISTGQMNWVRANRVLGKRLDASTGVTAVALLTLTEILATSSDWWKSHDARPDARANLQQIFHPLESRPGEWSRERFYEEVSRRISDSNIGWARDRLRLQPRSQPDSIEAPLDLESLLERYESLKRREAQAELVRQLGEDVP